MRQDSSRRGAQVGVGNRHAFGGVKPWDGWADGGLDGGGGQAVCGKKPPVERPGQREATAAFHTRLKGAILAVEALIAVAARLQGG